jgi:hypothetical protein
MGYREEIELLDKKIHVKIKQINLFVIIRSVLFFILFIQLYFFCTNPTWISGALFGFLTVLLIITVKCSERTNKRGSYYQILKRVYENELKAQFHQVFHFPNGSEFNDMSHPYVSDLDVFGEHSLFQMLNRCHTSSGHSYLAQQLKYPFDNTGLIRQRQEAVKELSRNHWHFIFGMQALLSMKKKQQTSFEQNIHFWLQRPKQLGFSKMMLYFIYTMPFLNLILWGFALIYVPFYSILFLCMVCQCILLNCYHTTIQKIQKDINLIINDIVDFDIYTNTIKKLSFRSSKLQSIQQEIVKYHKSIRQLQRQSSFFDMSDNLMGSIGNAIFLTRIKTAVKLEQWKENNRTTFPVFIEAISELETIISLAVFSINHPKFEFPDICEKNSSIMIETHDLGHPLIGEEKRITNNVVIRKNNFSIITGANMAGKSTFLRTIGINLVLARIGAPVCAASFRFRPVSLFASMRIMDKLDAGISYFYAEALRIREMLNFVQSGNDTLLIMDELFRGTNSEDRLKSSLSFIRKLTGYSNVAALIATHDLGITLLEKDYPEKIKNYFFECFNENDQITFDYQLKVGIVQSCNAYQLLQNMNIID